MITEILNNIANEINQLGKTSWLDIVSLFVSCGSLIFAILIPVRIANKQNCISLFEKRLSAYFEILKLVRFSNYLKNSDFEEEAVAVKNSRTAEKITANFSLIFNCDLDSSDSKILLDTILKTLEKNRITVESVPFLYSNLFKKNIKINIETNKIYDCLIELIKSNCINHTYIASQIKTFNMYTSEFTPEYLDSLSELLKM